MKVIGTPEAFEAARTCGGCRTRVIVEAGDLRVERISRVSSRIVARCVVCDQLMNLGTPDELPTGVRELAEKRPVRGGRT